MNRINVVFARIFLIAFTIGSFASTSFAHDRNDRTTKQARQAVEQASPDDWYTLAQSAEKCIAKGVNLKEAAEWIDQSLAIQETAYNLKIKGDYYLSNRLPEQALEYYSRSIRVGKLDNPGYMDADTQEKIVSLVQQRG